MCVCRDNLSARAFELGMECTSYDVKQVGGKAMPLRCVGPALKPHARTHARTTEKSFATLGHLDFLAKRKKNEPLMMLETAPSRYRWGIVDDVQQYRRVRMLANEVWVGRGVGREGADVPQSQVSLAQTIGQRSCQAQLGWSTDRHCNRYYPMRRPGF